MLAPGSKAVVPSQDAMTARISSMGGPETLAGVTSHLLRKNVSNQPGPGTSSVNPGDKRSSFFHVWMIKINKA